MCVNAFVVVVVVGVGGVCIEWDREVYVRFPPPKTLWTGFSLPNIRKTLDFMDDGDEVDLFSESESESESEDDDEEESSPWSC